MTYFIAPVLLGTESRSPGDHVVTDADIFTYLRYNWPYSSEEKQVYSSGLLGILLTMHIMVAVAILRHSCLYCISVTVSENTYL